MQGADNKMIFKNYDRIVFAGDSITDMGSAQPVGEGLFDNLGRSYVRVIENMLYTWYPELNFRITNSGISGNTSRDLLARYDRDVLSLSPDYVSICIGINDVWRQFDVPGIPSEACTPEEYESNLREMITRTKDKVRGIFLITPYFMEPCRADRMRARMDEYGDIVRRLAAEYGDAQVSLFGANSQALADLPYTKALQLLAVPEEERAALLKGMGYPEDYLEEKPACPLCGDTGYHGGQVCRCLREYYKRVQLTELSRMLDLGSQSFETFSHNRAIVDKATWIDLPMRYMPYKKLNDLLIRMFIH